MQAISLKIRIRNYNVRLSQRYANVYYSNGIDQSTLKGIGAGHRHNRKWPTQLPVKCVFCLNMYSRVDIFSKKYIILLLSWDLSESFLSGKTTFREWL